MDALRHVYEYLKWPRPDNTNLDPMGIMRHNNDITRMIYAVDNGSVSLDELIDLVTVYEHECDLKAILTTGFTLDFLEDCIDLNCWITSKEKEDAITQLNKRVEEYDEELVYYADELENLELDEDGNRIMPEDFSQDKVNSLLCRRSMVFEDIAKVEAMKVDDAP